MNDRRGGGRGLQRPLLAMALAAALLATGCAPADCDTTLRARAWADRDGDGVREPGEPPLAGVTIRARDGRGSAAWGAGVTDEQGEAVLAFGHPCGAGAWLVYAYPVPGYRQTTPDPVGEGAPLEFGFAPS